MGIEPVPTGTSHIQLKMRKRSSPFTAESAMAACRQERAASEAGTPLAAGRRGRGPPWPRVPAVKGALEHVRKTLSVKCGDAVYGGRWRD